jgi:hypothetical protein
MIGDDESEGVLNGFDGRRPTIPSRARIDDGLTG